MDRFQLKKSSKFGNMEGARGQGNAFIKRRMGSNLISSIPSEKDSFTIELKPNAPKKVEEAPMNLLLAEEMPKEKSIRRSPSVIAKLMGLDALPPQQPLHMEQRVYRSSHPKESIRSHAEYSFGKTRTELRQYKDVFEVIKTSNDAKQCSQLVKQGMETLKPSDTKMDFIRKKFMDVKHLSTDANLRNSKEFYDALEALYSNKELLLKFLQEPDSLFNKHHDSQVIPTFLQPRHKRLPKSRKVSNSDTRMLFQSKTNTEAYTRLQKGCESIIQKHERSSSLHSPFMEKNEACHLPTRIVVLKPNRSKGDRVENSILSQKFSRKELRSRNRELDSQSREQSWSANSAELSRRRSRGIAKDITQKMRQSSDRSSSYLSTSGMKSYAADESSGSVLVKDVMNDSEASSLTYRNSSGWIKSCAPPLLYSTEPLISREAKKCLSERLNNTQSCRVGLINGGSNTLREMLALSEKEELMALASLTHQVSSSDQSTRRERAEKWSHPLGISSKDGWKDESPRNLTRSRSLPASSSLERRPKVSIRHGIHSKDDSFVLNKSIDLVPAGALVESFFSKKEKLSSKNMKFQIKRVRSFREGLANVPANSEIRSVHKETKKHEEDMSKSSQRIFPKQIAVSIPCKTQSVCGVVATDNEDIASRKNNDKQLVRSVDSIKILGTCLNSEQTAPTVEVKTFGDPRSMSCCHVIELDSPQNSKEIEHPSPDSVLEPPCEEAFISDCFGSVNADLQGLRMQLQLLKLESAETLEGGTECAVSIENDHEAESPRRSEEKSDFLGLLREDNRSYNYLKDVLTESAFSGSVCESLKEMTPSFKLPLGEVLFEILEKKYSSQVEWPRRERRLLFDLIDTGLAEILETSASEQQQPWVRSRSRGSAGTACSLESLAEMTWQFLLKTCRAEEEALPAPEVECEFSWSEMGEAAYGVSKEMAASLVNKLIEEFLRELS